MIGLDWRLPIDRGWELGKIKADLALMGRTTGSHLGAKTVESHRAVLMEKLGLRSTASLVLYAVRNGFVSASDSGHPPDPDPGPDS